MVQAGGGTSVHAYRLRLHTSPDGSEHAYVYVSKRGEERREGGVDDAYMCANAYGSYDPTRATGGLMRCRVSRK